MKMELDCFDNKFYQVGKLVLSRVIKEWVQSGDSGPCVMGRVGEAEPLA